jgi:hypothetical protein
MNDRIPVTDAPVGAGAFELWSDLKQLMESNSPSLSTLEIRLGDVQFRKGSGLSTITICYHDELSSNVRHLPVSSIERSIQEDLAITSN